MNKKILIVTGIVLSVLLFGCNATNEAQANDKRMITISQEDNGKIVYDRETRVQYWMSYSNRNSGTLSVLVDSEGKPLLFSD